jgi:hypothetical protein
LETELARVAAEIEDQEAKITRARAAVARAAAEARKKDSTGSATLRTELEYRAHRDYNKSVLDALVALSAKDPELATSLEHALGLVGVKAPSRPGTHHYYYDAHYEPP